VGDGVVVCARSTGERPDEAVLLRDEKAAAIDRSIIDRLPKGSRNGAVCEQVEL